MIRSRCIGLAFAATISVVGAQPLPPTVTTGTARLALVSTAETADLAALLTTELSSQPNVVLLERDALAKIGEERKVQSMADTDAVALGKLVNADGLLFLNKENDQFRIRLTAVGLGYSIFDSRVASTTDTTQLIKAIAHDIGGFSPKLLLPPAKATPISLLNLRSDLATPNSTKTERDLTLLLESRLAAVPEYLVLERRHAWDLGFEHSLGSSTPPLLEGAYVLDGILRISGPNNQNVHAQIRVRAPKSGGEKSVEADGSASDLAALSDLLATRINQAIGAPVSPAAWQPQAEAREYLREGIWAWEHGQPPAAIEALDSAELLGEKAPDLLAARIEALCQVAEPDLNPFDIQFICDEGALPGIFLYRNPTRYYTPLQPLPDRLASVRRAINDLALYTQVAAQPLQILDPKWQHEVQLGYSRHFVIHAASSVLAEIDAQKNPEAETFRQEVRQLANFDPLNGKIPEDHGDGAFFAGEWAHSQDEETAYYRQVLSASGAQGQFAAIFLKRRFIIERGTAFCSRFIPDPNDREKAFLDFAHTLAQTPEGKLSGLLILSDFRDPKIGADSYAAFLDELYMRRDQLIRDHELQAHCLAAYFLPEDVRKKSGGHAVPILRSFLQTGPWDIRTIQALWFPESFPPDQAAAIWTDFKAYKARLIAPNGPEASYAFQEEAMFGAFESAFSRVFPDLAATAEKVPPLSVTRYWSPGTSANAGTLFILNTCNACANTLAVRGFVPGNFRQPKVYFLNVADLSATQTDMPENFLCYGGCALAPDALYAAGFTGKPSDGKSVLLRFDRANQTWQTRDIPPSYEGPEVVRGKIYLRLNTSNGQDPALARYDWDSGNLTILAAARRRPPQNQFDDRQKYQVLNVFPGLNQTLGVSIDFQCYTASEQPGKWPDLIPGLDGERGFPCGGKTFVAGYRDHLGFLLDPAQTQPQLLLAPPGAVLPPSIAPLGPAHWQIDPTTILKTFDGEVGLHGDTFLSFIRHQTVPTHFELLWFDPHQKEPLHIPLKFAMDSAVESKLRQLPGSLPSNSSLAGVINPEIDSFPLQAVYTDSGVCLWHPSNGVWFIPYADIESYLKNLHS